MTGYRRTATDAMSPIKSMSGRRLSPRNTQEQVSSQGQLMPDKYATTGKENLSTRDNKKLMATQTYGAEIPTA